jgi:hypothetical protein
MSRTVLSSDEKTELKNLSQQEKREMIEFVGQELYEWATEMLFRHDPIGLGGMDCPKNEYSLEARCIMSRVKNMTSVDKIHEIVWNVFLQMFSEHCAGEKEKYLPIAQDILKKLTDA